MDKTKTKGEFVDGSTLRRSDVDWRWKDVKWSVVSGNEQFPDRPGAILAILMDLRDRL